jgi:hypothetical protein
VRHSGRNNRLFPADCGLGDDLKCCLLQKLHVNGVHGVRGSIVHAKTYSPDILDWCAR